MPLKYVAIMAAILPIVAANASYLFSAWQGHVDWCVPYLQGCASISEAGRHGIAYFVFKGVMIPAAVVMAIYWWLNTQWLKSLGDVAQRARRLIVALGLLASVGLILYSCVLGSVGSLYYTQRRIGIILYFGLTFLAQLLTTQRVSKLAISTVRTPYLCQLGLCLSMLGLGLTHLALATIAPNIDEIEDVFEWNFALLMALYYLSSYWLWRNHSIHLAAH